MENQNTHFHPIILPEYGSSGLFHSTPGIQIPHHSDQSDWEMPGSVWRSPHRGHEYRHQRHPCDGVPGKQKLGFIEIHLRLFRKGDTLAPPRGPHITELLRCMKLCITSLKNLSFFTIQKDLISYSVCHRYKYFYDRPRMYLFTYAFDDKNANELFSGSE